MKGKLIIFFLIVFFIIPNVNADSMDWNNNIEQDYYFDGANYIMVTKYGNYTWLQPNNIMRYENLDNELVIDKSIWILQYNSTGVWLPLLDFNNQQIDLVNETFYEISYNVMYRYRGINYVVGNVSIGFYSSGETMNRPKITVNFIKSSNWDFVNGGLGSYRWIWDIVPSIEYRKIISGSSIIDISNTDFNGFGRRINIDGNILDNKYVTISTDDFFYNHTWIIDPTNRTRDNRLIKNSTDKGYVGIDIFGGSESYWNTKGYVFIYPINEGYIDPYTITSTTHNDVTAWEDDNRIFRNPAGLRWYYNIFVNQTGRMDCFKSENGTIWERDNHELGTWNIVGKNMDFTYWRNETGGYTVIFVQHTINNTGDNGMIWNQMYILDNETRIRELDNGFYIAPIDDGMFHPSIEIDLNGMIWSMWSEEGTITGKQRCVPYIFYFLFPYDEGINLMSSIDLIHGGKEYTENPDFLDHTKLVPLNRSFPNPVYNMTMAIVYSLDNSVSGTYMLNVTEYGYNYTKPYTLLPIEYPYSGDDMSVEDEHTGQEMIEYNVSKVQPYVIFSAFTQSNYSDVYVLHTPEDGGELQIDVAHPVLNTTSDNWADIYDTGGDSDSYTLTFIHELDEILVCWLNGSGTQENIIFLSHLNITNPSPEIVYNWTETSVTNLDYINAIDLAEYNNSLYSIYLVATNGTTNIRFYNWTLPPPPPYVVVITHISLDENETQVDDYEVFELNITLSIVDNIENFTRNILTLDPSGLALNITYLNGTGFSELYDPNNYITLETSESNKTDISLTQFYIKYVIYIHHNITKEGWFDVKSFSNETYQGANDTDTYSNVFNLTIRGTSTPSLLYGAGFNSSTPHIEIYWTHSGLVTDYEVQNSTNKISWFSLAYPTNKYYNDTSSELNNGTYRYYRVRARRSTGVGYKNSTWTDINLEKIYFIKAVSVGGGGINWSSVLMIIFLCSIGLTVIIGVKK